MPLHREHLSVPPVASVRRSGAEASVVESVDDDIRTVHGSVAFTSGTPYTTTASRFLNSAPHSTVNRRTTAFPFDDLTGLDLVVIPVERPSKIEKVSKPTEADTTPALSTPVMTRHAVHNENGPVVSTNYLDVEAATVHVVSPPLPPTDMVPMVLPLKPPQSTTLDPECSSVMEAAAGDDTVMTSPSAAASGYSAEDDSSYSFSVAAASVTSTNLSGMAYRDRATHDRTPPHSRGPATVPKTSLSCMQMMATNSEATTVTTTNQTSQPPRRHNHHLVDLDESVDDSTTTGTVYTARCSQSSRAASECHVPTPEGNDETVDQAMRRGTTMAYRADQSVMGTKDEHTIETGQSQLEILRPWAPMVLPTLTSSHSPSSDCESPTGPPSNRTTKGRCQTCLGPVVTALLVITLAIVAGGSVYMLWRFEVFER